MPKTYKAGGKMPAGENDSLEVHPATQAEPGDLASVTQTSDNDAASDADEAAEGDDAEEDDAVSADSQGFWEAEAILDEDKARYLIAWKGTDSDGKPWQPTWEPKANANQTLVQSWKQQRRASRKAAKSAKAAEKKRKLEVKTAKKDKQAPVVEAEKAKEQSAKTTGKKPSPSVDIEIEIVVDAPPARPSGKRKMVVPSSPSSSNASAVPPAAKKPKASTHKASPPQPRPAATKRVSFDIAVSSSEAEDVAEQVEAGPSTKKSQQEPSPSVPSCALTDIDLTTAGTRANATEDAEVVESSGSTSASNGTVIPDSQAVAYTPMAEKDGEEAAPERRTVRFNLPSGLHSPATSQSDLESVHAHDDDDIPLFNPLEQENEQASSPEVPAARRLGPVPVPVAAMFGISNAPEARSSQLDPIEDPDSSPHRPVALRQNTVPRASPRAQPVKQRLELVPLTDDDSPASSFEAEVQANAASSYVTVPLDPSPRNLQAEDVRILRTVGVSSASPRLRAHASTSAVIKRAPAQAVPAVQEVVVGGVVARVAQSWPSPPLPDEEEQVMTQAGSTQSGGLEEQFFADIFDFDAGAKVALASTAASAEAAQDANENGQAPNGHSQSYNPPPQPPTYPTQSYSANQNPYASTSLDSSAYAGGFAPSGPNNPLSHFPQQPSWPGAASAGTPKRQHEEEEEAGDSKKARVDQPAATQYPESAHAHSPYHALPEHPSFQTGNILSGNTASPAYSQSVASPAHQAIPSQTQLRIPSVGVTQASPLPLTSPSLARVQSTDPFVIPRPNTLATGEVSPSLARTIGGFRSPSPLPPSAAPVSAQAAGVNSRNVSRNGSPAPNSAQVDELVALVRASPYIVATDGTQDEIERFLRDPQGYSANPAAPLLSADFWAFELRRHAVDAVEKVDFIVIRSREGTFQLKRANTEKFPIEFSRSLAQTTRNRAMTPMAEGSASTAPFSPAVAATAVPMPPSVSQMSREQLEAEVERLRQQAITTDAELSSLRPLTAEVAQLRTDVQALTKQTKALQSSRESAQADLSYMQAQYQAASQAAVERANECRIAEANAARLQGMLDHAVQQKETLYKSEIKSVRSMYARLQKQMAHYKAESHRTQESAIREKAAKWDNHVASNEVNVAAAERERAGLPAEDSGDEAPAATAASESQPEPSTILSSISDPTTSPAKGPPRLPSHVPASSLGLDSLPTDVSQPDRPLPEVEAGSSSATGGNEGGLPIGDLLVAGAAGQDEFRCEWRVGPSDTQAETCGEAKESRTQLREHVLREHMHD
ncbi:hypothetical protein JCM10908_000422 [Rhodotorula pacifica]|uniref:uncharacterized protein n=1 Tax=Rhodotorula pacifica TaxID=1495444 RepID=UPI003176E078